MSVGIKKELKGKSRRKSRKPRSGTTARKARALKYSPAWLLNHSDNSQEYKFEVIDRIRAGVQKSEWKQLIHTLDATEKEFEDVLPVSISTMQKKNVYDKETSERIYELARLFGLGYQVFDTKEDFKSWLLTASRALGNKKPFLLLDSSFGFELVKNEIIRIKYNVYS